MKRLALLALVLCFASPPVGMSPAWADSRDGFSARSQVLGTIDQSIVVDSPARAVGSARSAVRWKWRGRRLTYWSELAPDYRWSLAAAVKSWNSTGLDMRLVRAKKKRKAQVILRPEPGSDMSGSATVGVSRGRASRAWITVSRAAFSRPEAPDMQPWHVRTVMAQILTHEFGHVLGLDHQPATSVCGLMEAVHEVEACPNITSPGVYRCGMVDRWALSRLVRAYGGKRTVGPATCPLVPMSRALTGVQLSGGAEESAPVTIRWQPLAPRPGERVELVMAGQCAPWTTDDYGAPRWDPDETVVQYLDPAAGAWTQPGVPEARTECYAVRLVNEAGSSLGGFTTATRTSFIPPPPAPVVISVTPTTSFGSKAFEVRVVQSGRVVVGDLGDAYTETDDFYVFVDPRGGCRGSVTHEEVWSDARSFHGGGDEVASTTTVVTDVPDPCLTVVALRHGTVPGQLSPVTMYQVP